MFIITFGSILISCFEIQIYRNEVHSKLGNKDQDDNDKDGCEMEYLRNILYEYMMGKQPMVNKYFFK